jgi:hypothetical protein
LSGSQTPLVVTDAPVSCDIWKGRRQSRIHLHNILTYLLLRRPLGDQVPIPQIVDVDIMRKSAIVLILLLSRGTDGVGRRTRTESSTCDSAHGCCYPGSDGS